MRRKPPQTVGFVTELCYRFNIIMALCALLPEVANIAEYEMVTQPFNYGDSGILG